MNGRPPYRPIQYRIQEPARLPSTPATVMPSRVRSPSLTAKPAKGMMASLGTRMPALSSAMSTKTAPRPQSPMSAVAHWTTGSMIDCIMPASVPYRWVAGEH
ncbi:MAG: hypothetical protein BWY94_01802 [Actinobacteria bacterium ADurb.BinA094]|nr:MAG: hypothetical protein BWY94_01802 [Actinobacteria bacterium ADurb.BinA094]